MMLNGGMPRERDGCTFHLSRGNLLWAYVTSNMGFPISQTARLFVQSPVYPTLINVPRLFNHCVAPP